MNEKKFNDIFSKIKLSANVKSVFKDTIVKSIEINTIENIANIYIESFEVINEKAIKDFEEDICYNFGNINKARINLKYNFTKLGNLSETEKINKVWSNILNLIKEDSPLCFTIIREATFEIQENLLNINLPRNGSFIFKSKKLDIFIQNMLKDRFDINKKVQFIDKNTKSNYESREQDLRKIIEKTINQQSSNSNVDETNYNDNQSGTEINRFRRVKKVSLKVKESISEEIRSIKGSINDGEKIVIKGSIFSIDTTETRTGKLIVKVDITDKTDSLTFKFFTNKEEFSEYYKNIIKKGNFVILKGEIRYDDYIKELILTPSEICKEDPPPPKVDNSQEKRVELHVHTQMSKMDAVSNVKDIIKRASEYGHKAIAITDHAVVQAFPDAMDTGKKCGVKILYGVEAYLIDDLVDVVENSKNQNLLDEYVVFDLETTGLSQAVNKIIEIGAVRVKNGEIIDRFSSFINPKEKLSAKIIELTGITDDMLKDALSEDEVLPNFFNFFSKSVLVAHNAKFDMGFIKKWARTKGIVVDNTVVDTVGLSRALFPDMTRHTLNTIAKKLDVSLENHHRAVDDAEATANIFIKFIDILKNSHKVDTLDKLNELANISIDVKKLRPNHAIIFAKNQQGLKNLYKLISKSNLEYFFRDPRIPKSEFVKLREGLVIGTACEAGELYQAVLNDAPDEEIQKLAEFYDYFEIQPTKNNAFLIENEKVSSVNSFEDLENINRKIIQYGKLYNKLTVATCDVHFLDEEDDYYRKIIMASKGFKDADNQPPLYYRNTEEMLQEFSYLGEELAKEVVITNTNKIADIMEDILPIPNGTFPPEMENSDKNLTDITMTKAKSIYGDNLPDIVKERLDRELNSIIKNGFAVLYIIAQKIVWNSNDNGYIVGSRGSVGSSFAATMAGITEVNPLSPHYFCKNCRYSDFDSDEVKAYAGNSGWDLPDKNCPACGEVLSKDGHDIPFETFLGFEGDKEPDIDLNFSGEFQAKAHQYTEELFGKDFVFKAGTIGTLADKTAYGFVKKYADERGLKINSAEVNRLVTGCVGIKRTSGQHPGGLMVVPNNKSIYDFCPVQRPADDPNSSIITTHFDYHSISGRILKLDLLGHDVPTIIRMLKDFTGFDPLDTPMDDKGTMSLFTTPKALGVTKEEIDCETGSLGLPEFGTPFVVQMLVDTQPNSFSDLVRISGLSHGTDVWFNNAQELIKNNITTLKGVIPTRDDIMVYLIIKGVENKLAFTIMESVRKGNGLSKEFEDAMIEKNVPDWYIESCKRIKYMFPKGHAVAYVTNAFRMGYFKINYPEAFYASLFSVKIDDFDYDLMCFGIEKVENAIRQIMELGKQATTKEKSKLVVLELVREMYKRKINFVPLNLYTSKGFKFDICEDGLMPPLCTVQGLGENATNSLVEARENGIFNTIEELSERTKISKTVLEILKNNGVLKGIPDTNQLTFF